MLILILLYVHFQMLPIQIPDTLLCRVMMEIARSIVLSVHIQKNEAILLVKSFVTLQPSARVEATTYYV